MHIEFVSSIKGNIQMFIARNPTFEDQPTIIPSKQQIVEAMVKILKNMYVIPKQFKSKFAEDIALYIDTITVNNTEY